MHNIKKLNSKNMLFYLYVLVFSLSVSQLTGAMHIMEGFLPPSWCIIWGALCVPPIILGIGKINSMLKSNRQVIILLAMAGAFSFVLSALKIPSVTGSSSHMTGLGFSAIMFGPWVSSILGAIVLLFQALLLAHGGLTTLGANTFSMGVVGPVLAFLIYAGLNSAKCPKKVSIFLAASLGDLATYVVTSIQLAIAYPGSTGGVMESFSKFAGIFAFTQVPLAIIEGILTVVLVNVISAYGKDMFTTIGKDVFVYE